MALRTIGGGTYYYRSIREGGRVRSEYVGGGELAIMAAAMDDERRAEAEEDERIEDEAWKAERSVLEADERLVAGYLEAIGGAVDEAMEAAGYHRPSRHNRWVKRHVD